MNFKSDKQRRKALRNRPNNRMQGQDRWGLGAMQIYYCDRDGDFMLQAAKKYARLYHMAADLGEFKRDTIRSRRIFVKFKTVMLWANMVINEE